MFDTNVIVISGRLLKPIELRLDTRSRQHYAVIEIHNKVSRFDIATLKTVTAHNVVNARLEGELAERATKCLSQNDTITLSGQVMQTSSFENGISQIHTLIVARNFTLHDEKPVRSLRTATASTESAAIKLGALL